MHNKNNLYVISLAILNIMRKYLDNLRILLSQKMNEKGWSIMELSIMCDLSYHTMRNIVNGNAGDINLSTLDKICENTGISYLDIYDITYENVLQKKIEELIIFDQNNQYRIKKV